VYAIHLKKRTVLPVTNVPHMTATHYEALFSHQSVNAKL